MKRILGLAIGGVLLAAGVARAIPPGPGQHFDCSDGGDTSCAVDDPGCVSNLSKGHLACSTKIGRALGRAVVSTIVCHNKQAEMRFKGASETGAGNSEENCEENPGNSAKGKLDKVLAGLADAGFCDPAQLAGAAAEEAVLFGAGPASLDGQNGNVFCDSSSGAFIGDDDSGFVPATAEIFKCEVGVAKAVARLVLTGVKCHDKMNRSFFKGVDFDEEVCEEHDPVRFRGGLDKFNQARDKLLAAGICPPCLDGAGMDAIAASVISQLDAANGLVYPCNLGP